MSRVFLTFSVLFLHLINQRSSLPSSENCITWHFKYCGKELWGQNYLYDILIWCCLYHCVYSSQEMNGELCGCVNIDRLPVDCLMVLILIGVLKRWIIERIDWCKVWHIWERSCVRKSTSYVTGMARCDNVLMDRW